MMQAMNNGMFDLNNRGIAQRIGRSIAMLASNLLENELANRSIVILIGENEWLTIALAAAHQLWLADAWVQIICSSRDIANDNSESLRMLGIDEFAIPFVWAEDGWELPPSDLIIDAILCGSGQATVAAQARNLILLANSSAAPILSVGAPSGIDIQQNYLSAFHIHASATVMAGLPYRFLLQQPIRSLCGTLYLIDVGMDSAVYAKFDLAPPHFDENGLAYFEYD